MFTLKATNISFSLFAYGMLYVFVSIADAKMSAVLKQLLSSGKLLRANVTEQCDRPF
jgi:hypothetical protein